MRGNFRLLGIALLALALAACASQGRRRAVGPGQEGGAGAGEQAGAGDGGNAGRAGGAGGEGGALDVKPPGLDLPEPEKQRRIAEHLKRGQTALDTSNDPDLAIAEARQALAVDETSVDAMVLLAEAQYVKGYYDLVQDVLEKALARGGDQNKKLHFLLGMVHDRSKRPDQALASYQKAVDLDPNYKSALMNLGVHLLQDKRYQEAVSLYENLTGRLAYRTPASLTNLGSAYRGLSSEFNTSDIARRNELLIKAERAYQQALAGNRNYANAYYNMGLLYLDADPFPAGQNDMDFIVRLQRAKSQFDEYRRLPGADQRLADEQVAVAQKLIEKEERARQKAREREAKQKARESKDAARKEQEGAQDGADKEPAGTPR